MFYAGNKSQEQEGAQVTNSNAYRNGQAMWMGKVFQAHGGQEPLRNGVDSGELQTCALAKGDSSYSATANYHVKL